MTGKNKPDLAKMDIFDLPVLRQMKRQYGRLLFANQSVRREAKALLFNELRTATTLGMPMEEALRRVGQTHGEAQLTIERMSRHGADNRNGVMKVLFAILLIFTSALSMIVYFFSSFRMADTEAVARRMARRLVRFVERGRNLSEAMEALKSDYTYEEIMMVRAGENWGRISEALHQISRINSSVGQLAIHKSHIGYPLFVFVVVLNLLLFFINFIQPKFIDIANQVAVPYVPVFMAQGGNEMALLMGLAFVLASLMLPFLILRTLMNGTTEMKILIGLVLVANGIFLIFTAVLGIVEYFPEFTVYTLPVAGVVALIFIFYLPAIMGGIEWVINFIERVFFWIFSMIPLIGLSEKLRRESIWVATLSLALKSGTAAHEAIDFATRSSQIMSRKKASKAMSLAEAGHPIGYSCLKSGFLRKKFRNKLVLHDGGKNYVESLANLAEEVAYENYERQGRLEAIFETTAILCIGLIVFSAASTVYAFFSSIATMKL